MSGFTLSINKVGTFRSILSPSTKYTHLDMQLIQTFKTLSLGTDTLHLLFGEIGMNIILLTINLSAEKHQYKKYAKGIVGNGLTGLKKNEHLVVYKMFQNINWIFSLVYICLCDSQGPSDLFAPLDS